MRIWLFIVSFFVVSANSSLLFAQIIGDDALRKVQSGQASTLEGEFIAYLADTVSPDYATSQLEALGFELGNIDIQPFTIAIVNQPDSGVLKELASQPEVLDFENQPDLVDSAYFRDLLGSQDLSPEEARAALERIIQSQRVQRLFIRFNYSMDERAVKKFMGTYRSVAYEIISDFPRTINILVEPGTEKDQMLVVEELPFVKYTALIGIIGE